MERVQTVPERSKSDEVKGGTQEEEYLMNVKSMMYE